MKEFSEQLQALRLREKVAVYPCSHIGGHKWAGTLIVYPQGDWYGRVTTCHVKPLLEQAVLEGKIIKEIWRGRGTLPLKK